jgi:hypothetical protein
VPLERLDNDNWSEPSWHEHPTASRKRVVCGPCRMDLVQLAKRKSPQVSSNSAKRSCSLYMLLPTFELCAAIISSRSVSGSVEKQLIAPWLV